MPLAQLVQAAAASGRPPKRPRQRAPQQQDVCTLLVHVLLRVQQGRPLCLETVKATWRELAFSHVFEVRRQGTLLIDGPPALGARWCALAVQPGVGLRRRWLASSQRA